MRQSPRRCFSAAAGVLLYGTSGWRAAEASPVWCNSFWLTAYQPTPYQTYATCSDSAWSTADFTVPGTAERIHVDCWCQNSLAQSWRDMYSSDPAFSNTPIDCCQTDLWRNMCSLDCAPDCTDARATDCVTNKCPPLCLETAYENIAFSNGNPGGQMCECDQCWDKMKCIFEHAVAQTASGDSIRVCDAQAFERTTEAANWIACVSVYPHATRWEQVQASAHCACKTDISAALNTTSCCTSPNYEHLCTDTMQAQCSNLDTHCASAEATSCLSDCASLCDHISETSAECRTKCLEKGAQCAKYQKCEPPATKTHDYICDDGATQPTVGGCCRREDFNFQTRDNVWCPRFCGTERVYWLVATQRYECDCEACPRDMSGLHNSWNADLALEIDRRYKTGLERIMERLQTPEEKKAEPVALYAEMTTEVMRAYPYTAAALPQAFPTQALSVVEEYQEKIEEKAISIWNLDNPGVTPPSLDGVWTWSSADWSSGSTAPPGGSLGVIGNTDGSSNLGGAIANTGGSESGTSSVYSNTADDDDSDALSWLIGFAVMAGISFGICLICIGVEKYSSREREAARRRDADISAGPNGAYSNTGAGPLETVVVGQPVFHQQDGQGGVAGQGVGVVGQIPTGLIMENDKSQYNSYTSAGAAGGTIGRGFSVGPGATTATGSPTAPGAVVGTPTTPGVGGYGGGGPGAASTGTSWGAAPPGSLPEQGAPTGGSRRTAWAE